MCESQVPVRVFQKTVVKKSCLRLSLLAMTNQGSGSVEVGAVFIVHFKMPTRASFLSVMMSRIGPDGLDQVLMVRINLTCTENRFGISPMAM